MRGDPQWPLRTRAQHIFFCYLPIIDTRDTVQAPKPRELADNSCEISHTRTPASTFCHLPFAMMYFMACIPKGCPSLLV